MILPNVARDKSPPKYFDAKASLPATKLHQPQMAGAVAWLFLTMIASLHRCQWIVQALSVGEHQWCRSKGAALLVAVPQVLYFAWDVDPGQCLARREFPNWAWLRPKSTSEVPERRKALSLKVHELKLSKCYQQLEFSEAVQRPWWIR